jgi:drug/metabolite transporter (DMT)-like permease
VTTLAADRAPLDAAAAATMVVLCLCWGFQQVAIKAAAPFIPLLMQASIRSAVALVLVIAWAAWRRIPLWEHDRTLGAGVLAGILFATEFALIYGGLAHTAAARMVVFLFTAPCFTALGVSLWVPGEKLGALQWLGVALAFAGIAAGFGESALHGASTLLGDAMGLTAALVWAATTVIVRATPLARVSATKVLLYQLAISALMLPLASLFMHEHARDPWHPTALASLAFQSVVVAFASYLAWFWLLTRYLASRLTVFSFLTPLFGVLFGTWLLHEPLTPGFAGAAALVATGIALVNVRPRASP